MKKLLLNATVNQSKINIADSFKLTLTLKSPKKENLLLPSLGLEKIEEFVIEDLMKEIEIKNDETIQKNTYDLTIYQTGVFYLPSFVF